MAKVIKSTSQLPFGAQDTRIRDHSFNSNDNAFRMMSGEIEHI